MLDTTERKGHNRRLQTLFSKAFELHRKVLPHQCRVAIFVEVDGKLEIYLSSDDQDWPPNLADTEDHANARFFGPSDFITVASAKQSGEFADDYTPTPASRDKEWTSRKRTNSNSDSPLPSKKRLLQTPQPSRPATPVNNPLRSRSMLGSGRSRFERSPMSVQRASSERRDSRLQTPPTRFHLDNEISGSPSSSDGSAASAVKQEDSPSPAFGLGVTMPVTTQAQGIQNADDDELTLLLGFPKQERL